MYRSVTVFEFSTSDGGVGFFIYQVVMSLSSKGLYVSLVLRSVLSCNCSSCIESLHRYLSAPVTETVYMAKIFKSTF